MHKYTCNNDLLLINTDILCRLYRYNCIYYDYQLSKAARKFVEKFWRSNFGVTTGNFPCFQW